MIAVTLLAVLVGVLGIGAFILCFSEDSVGERISLAVIGSAATIICIGLVEVVIGS